MDRGVPHSYRRYRQKESRGTGRHKKNTLNEAGLKEDIMAKVLLSEDAYEKAYKPTVEALMQSNVNVQEASRDSALIYARMIDSLARNYKLPVENIVATIQATEEGASHTNEFHSPVNRGIKPDTLVTVVDLTKYMPDEPIDRKTMLKFVKEALADKLIEETADKKAIISLPNESRQIRHVTSSNLYKTLNYRQHKEWKKRHQAGLLDIAELIRNSVLIESEPNRKANKKGSVSRYHHFYLPIKAYDKLYTAHIVGEEMKDSMGYDPIDIKLYDVIVNKKANPMQATRSDLRAKDLPFKLTVSEMLRNVKDSHNQPFINKDGTLSQGINFYANNDSNYYQTVEEPSGKKDLIAYHNISQDNLDKAIQLGGLAVPSIAITKKETDFSNFGNITLLMPQDVVNLKETPVYTRDAWTGVFPIHTVDTAKKRVEALEDIKNTLNKAGLKEDIMAKVLLSEDAYEKAYKPTVEALMQSNGNVQEAARDSALIYARMIDSLARNYKLPVENIVATISTHGAYQNGMYGSPVTEVYTGNETFDAVNLDNLLDKIGITGKDEGSKQQVVNIINNMFRDEQVTTAD